MATDREIRRARPGWQAVFFYGCDTDPRGDPLRGTADKIVKHWTVTREQAESIVPDGGGA